jgi:argininosuccinate lyase
MGNNKKDSSKDSSKVWGGRFDSAPDDIMEQINASIGVDKRFYNQDINGSIAHAKMLGKCGIVSEDEAGEIIAGLGKVRAEIDRGEFNFRSDYEDIHMNVEMRLKDLIGDIAGKLHTARSRNDQVATDFRLWVREACGEVISKIENTASVFEEVASKHKDTVMPGFTHLQVAQPVTLAKHLDAYVQMLSRDKGRFEDCRKRVNECPLGAAAMSGTGFPIDREMTAEELGFDRPMSNTMDAVSARDFANEFLFACAQCGLHLSRMAEEVIIWATPQFGFISLSDSWSTGSSIMPQKKNPDAAELVRGKTGRLTGNLNQLMIVMKGLPLTYNKDLQEDKEPVFDSFDTICLCLDAMAGMIGSAQWGTDEMLAAAESGYSTATELADWLVRELGMPFRDAHHVTGRIVRMAEEKGCKLDELPLSEMQEIEPLITDGVFTALSVESAVKSRSQV